MRRERSARPRGLGAPHPAGCRPSRRGYVGSGGGCASPWPLSSRRSPEQQLPEPPRCRAPALAGLNVSGRGVLRQGVPAELLLLEARAAAAGTREAALPPGLTAPAPRALS